MSVSYNPSIVRDGLVAYLDADNPKSYNPAENLLQYSEHWQSLKAVKENRVFIADGNAFFSRPGPRIIDSAEIIAEILQVNQFYFGLEGSAWEWLNA